MRLVQSIAVFALVGAAAVPAFAVQEAPQLPGTMDVSRVSGGTYETDPSHTLVAWTVNHFGFNDYFWCLRRYRRHADHRPGEPG